MKLPTLKWQPSPNVSDRTAKIDKIIVHDCQGSYAGSIATFMDPSNGGNPVSAHLVLKDDGSEVTQMVSFDKKAWHCVSFNSSTIGLEMAGYAERGFPESEWQNAANIVAYLLRRFSLPCRWAHQGQGAGFTSHFDLGRAGGGHSDPTTDPKVWADFVDRVTKAYNAGGFPGSWGRGEPPAIGLDAGTPATVTHAPIAQSPNGPGSVLWLQRALNKLGAEPRLDEDGMIGPMTRAALYAWQAKSNLVANGQISPVTVAALEKMLAA